MKVISVYRAFATSEDGKKHPLDCYKTKEAAKAACRGIFTAPSPVRIEAVLLESGRIVPLSYEEPLYSSREEKERQEILERLSERERRLLDLPDP